jgi:hypothetical protein
MKQIMPIFLILLSANSFGQCKTVYGGRSNCPSFNDSLELYKNTLEVLKFYEKNPAYQKIRTVAVRTEKERKDVFDRLQNARRLFHLVRQPGQNMDTNSTIKRPTDISYSQYFKYINEHRFQQRELENQIINHHSPYPLYDNRISPLVVNEYKCIGENNEYLGDLVNIPLYVPLMVKPMRLLTKKEKEAREEIARKIEDNDLENIFGDLNETSETAKSGATNPPNKKQKGVEGENAKPDKTALAEQKAENNEPVKSKVPAKPDEPVIPIKPAFVFDDRFANPIYYYNQYGSGSIIGFSIKQYFRKLRPEEYDTYMLPKSTREFLSDEIRMQNWLRTRYGNYYTFFL